MLAASQSIPERGTFDVDVDDPSTPAFTVSHWFDGLTVIHKFSVEHGRVDVCVGMLKKARPMQFESMGAAKVRPLRPRPLCVRLRRIASLSRCDDPPPRTNERLVPSCGVTYTRTRWRERQVVRGSRPTTGDALDDERDFNMSSCTPSTRPWK